jgi:DNA repair exonuclease SbcCD ATPase subunit
MKIRISKTVLLAAGITIIMLSAGCQEEELQSDKKNRVIAAENIQLKKEIKKRDEKIERLKKQHEKKLQQQEELLDKYAKQKEALEKQLQKGVKNQIDDVLTNLIEENAKLRDEINRLEAELEELAKVEKNPKF